jgi:hypothetical protein
MDQTNLFELLLTEINNQLATQNNTMLRINHNNIQNDEEVTTPIARLHADRYNTATSVDKVVNGITRQVKWFSDFQMAWIWIDNEVKRQIQEGDSREWRVKSFENTADLMDERWEDGEEGGVVIAKTLNTTGERVKYMTFYDPGETQAIRDYHQRINSSQAQVHGTSTPPFQVLHTSPVPRLNLTNIRRL